MEWEGLGEERGEEGSEEVRAASSQMCSENGWFFATPTRPPCVVKEGENYQLTGAYFPYPNPPPLLTATVP